MQSAVIKFNALPRPKFTSSDVANHWVFAIRHVPIKPEADLLMIVNPISRLSHCAGPAHLQNLGPRDKGLAVAQLLLSAFNSGMGNPEAPALGPWTWSTDDAELAQDVGAAMNDFGVIDILHHIGNADAEARRVAEEEWQDLLATIKRSVSG